MLQNLIFRFCQNDTYNNLLFKTSENGIGCDYKRCRCVLEEEWGGIPYFPGIGGKEFCGFGGSKTRAAEKSKRRPYLNYLLQDMRRRCLKQIWIRLLECV